MSEDDKKGEVYQFLLNNDISVVGTIIERGNGYIILDNPMEIHEGAVDDTHTYTFYEFMPLAKYRVVQISTNLILAHSLIHDSVRENYFKAVDGDIDYDVSLDEYEEEDNITEDDLVSIKRTILH